MKTTMSQRILRSAAVALALLSGSLTNVQAAAQDRIDAAWQQALALAGTPPDGLVRPEVVFDEGMSGRPDHTVAEFVPYVNEVRIHQNGRVPAQFLLVHEFLHAIYHQTQSGSLSLAVLAQADPSESWVRERMASRRSL